MANPLAKAEARLKEIEQEAEDLRKFISMYHALENGEVDATESPQPADSANVQKPVVRHRERVRALKPAHIVEMARKLMVARGSPMTRGELVEAMEAQGGRVSGEDKARNMGTILWRSKKFVNIGGEGYWPKDLDCPAAGYHGESPKPARPEDADPEVEDLLG